MKIIDQSCRKRFIIDPSPDVVSYDGNVIKSISIWYDDGKFQTLEVETSEGTMEVSNLDLEAFEFLLKAKSKTDEKVQGGDLDA